jgi:hypothetical protein
MQSVTILREYKMQGACADCGETSRLLTPAYNRFTESEVRLCAACSEWHRTQMDEKVRIGSWGAALPGAVRISRRGA